MKYVNRGHEFKKKQCKKQYEKEDINKDDKRMICIQTHLLKKMSLASTI